MSIRQTLNEVLAGAKPPAAFLSAVDEYLAQPNANTAALRSLIDAAEHLGLPADIAEAARSRIPGDDGVMGIGEPTRVAGSDETTEIMSPEATKVDIGEPTKLADDAEEKTVVTTGSAPTRLRANPADVDLDRTEFTGDADRTVVTGDNDTTQVNPDSDATVQVGGDDPFAMASSPAPKGGDELGPGSVLKGRFRLEEVIGQGGMGAVYKAVDLLKVEARDRNPYIAVKLLVGDFKEHPEAFIALQRESAKAQRLAHPNIATVYDFDRDGETVYMTMELMVGAELAKYIKKLPAGGLPVLEAMKVIEQLCAGLQYAHARGLVHSDFKPGNAFLLEDGTVKLLDFGIARASKTKADAEGESTVFDPGQLGALTPAYATIEMFEGQDPDPRDDIYALACVAYELFTGKHPFNKMSAVKAKEKGLKPAPVEKLTKRQNKTLLKALALHRDDRTPSVDEFWENIKPRKDYTLHIAAGATVATLVLGALLYNPIVNLIHDREYDAIVAAIEADVPSGLAMIEALPTQERRDEAAQRARQPVLAYFQERANAAAVELDFPTALAEADRAGVYLRNDGGVANLKNGLMNDQRDASLQRANNVGDLLVRGTRVEGQSQAAHRAVLEETLLPNETELDLPEAVNELRRINPEHDILEDARISGQYAVLVEAAVTARQWQRASDILTVAQSVAPRSPQLTDLGVAVGTELRRQQEATQVASLQDTLRQARPRTIAEFRAVNEALQQLGALRPDDTVVRGLDAALQTAVQGEVQRHAQAGEWVEADALLAEFAPALPLDFLIDTRLTLTADQTAAGYTNPDEARAAQRAELLTSLRQLVAQPDFEDIAYGRALVNEFKRLTALVGADAGDWEALRESIVTMHVAQATTLAESDFHRQAASVLDQGAVFHAGHPAFAEARTTLAAAERAYNEERARQEALALIETEKKKVTDLAAARNPDAAATYRALLAQLPANDPFVERGAASLEEMYLAMAADLVGSNARQAVEFLEGGLRVVDRPALRQRRDEYRLLANAATVTNAVRGLTESGFAAWRNSYTQAREALPQNRRTQFDNDIVAALVARLNELNAQSGARPLRALAVDLFSGQQRQRLADMNLREPSRFAAGIRALIDDKKLTEAEAALADAERAERGHPQLAGFSAEINRLKSSAGEHYSRALNLRSSNQIPQAGQAIDAARAIWADNPTYLELQRTLVGTVARSADDGTRPCTPAHAAQGTRGNGRCWDVVAPRDPAPSLVVVPAGDGHPMFAISRQEVTVEDFNKYCAATGSCTAVGGDSAMPVTGISIQQADAYVDWLSGITGKAYRIPTPSEWRYAANAAGSPGVAGNYNCTVMNPNGSKAKGATMLRATAGEQNGWGLLNVLGNAQEWTRGGGSLTASGASHNDSLSDCRVDFTRPHSGAADDVTGFRVAREF